MNKQNVVRVLLWAAVLALMILIFLFSSQPAPESSATSSPFVDLYLKLFHPEADGLSPEEQFELREAASFVVRKAAHFSIYAVLGLLLCAAVKQSLPPDARLSLRLAASFLPGALYAAADEIHQSFVPGRSCELRDVMIDSAGILTGVLLFAALGCIAARIRRGKADSE